MKSIRFLAAAGLLAVVGASPVSAWSGDLIKCTASAGGQIDINFKKGLSCKDTLNKISIKTKVKNGLPDGNPNSSLNGGIDGCVANLNAPWAEWNAGKFEKATAADLANVAVAEVSLKGITFGSCDFAGSDTSAGASASGAVTFFDDGTSGKFNKIKGAKLKFFGTVGGDTAAYSANATGLVTKGLGVGGNIEIVIGLDLAAPENSNLLNCNLGVFCGDPNDPNDPVNLAPVEVLKVVTSTPPSPLSTLTISRGEPDPNDPNDPFDALP